MKPAPKFAQLPDPKRAERRAEMLRWLATSQAEREINERLALHRELAFGVKQ